MTVTLIYKSKIEWQYKHVTKVFVDNGAFYITYEKDGEVERTNVKFHELPHGAFIEVKENEKGELESL